MTDTWRRKSYYKPRVLIDTERVLNPQYSDSVLCITGSELEMLRNLTQYLHRRSTFVSEYADDYYLAPSNEDWDSLEAITAHLEETLMGCEEFLSLLQDILTQVACVCAKTTIVADVVNALPLYGPSLQPVVDGFVTDGSMQIYDDYGDNMPATGERCDVAQLAFALAYEFTTEIMQPVASEAVDVLLPLAMVALAVMCGTSLLGIPIGVCLALLWSLIKIDVEGSIEDVRNAILANKDDLICAIWRGMMFGYSTAQANATAVIDDMSGLSVLDKVALRLLFTPFIFYLAGIANANETSWAQANIISGACDDCEEIEGSDWWAIALEPTVHTIDLTNTGNAHWEKGCWQGSVADGETCCGLVYRVQSQTGDCVLKAMSGPDAECTGLSIWPNTSQHIPNGTYFSVNPQEIDEADCKSVLAPGAVDWPAGSSVIRRAGPCDVNAGFHFGWSCTGSVQIIPLFQVFEGEPP